MILPLSLFVFGSIFLGYGLYIGEITVGLIVFIPFITSNGFYGFLGISCFFLSMLSLFFILPKIQQNIFHEPQFDDQTSTHTSKMRGVIFIGPIPIVFGSNKKITKTMILVSIIILIIILVSLMLHFY